MNDDERLYCRCGGEVRIVRLNARYLTLGHVSGGQRGHYVRLARPAAVDVHSSTRGDSDGLRGHRRLTEEPEVDRAGFPGTGSSSIEGREVHPKGRAHGQGDIPVSSTGSDPDTLRAIPAPASEAGLTPATPRVGNAAGRRRSTRRRVSPASAA